MDHKSRHQSLKKTLRTLFARPVLRESSFPQRRSATAILLLAFLSLSTIASAQKGYFTSNSEWIFSFASYSDSGDYKNAPPRFSAFFHFNERYHYDFGKRGGMFIGLSMRNVGFIADVNDSIRKKHRVYTLGVPLALKIGNMEKKRFVYAGAEVELPFNYKEKTFIHHKKRTEFRFNEWFSRRTMPLLPSVFAGIQNKNGVNLQAKYYLSGFFNKSYRHSGINPYRNTDVQVFYISILFPMPDRDAFRQPGNDGINTLAGR